MGIDIRNLSYDQARDAVWKGRNTGNRAETLSIEGFDALVTFATDEAVRELHRHDDDYIDDDSDDIKNPDWETIAEEAAKIAAQVICDALLVLDKEATASVTSTEIPQATWHDNEP